MTEKEFENLKVGDKVWKVSDWYTPDYKDYQFEVVSINYVGKHIIAKGEFGSNTYLPYATCYLHRSEAWGEIVKFYEEKIKDEEADMVVDKKALDRYKAELSKAREEEEKIKEAKEVAKFYECFPRLKICGEQKKEEQKEYPCQHCDFAKDFSGMSAYPDCYLCSKFDWPVKKDRTTCMAEEQREYGKPDFKVKIKSPTEESLVKIEQRLTEIDGVLSSIGSPEYDLRKKVEGLEKGLAQLTDTFYICANNETHNYEDLRKKVEDLEKRLRNY